MNVSERLGIELTLAITPCGISKDICAISFYIHMVMLTYTDTHTRALF